MESVGSLPILRQCARKLEMWIKDLPLETVITWEQIAEVSELPTIRKDYRHVLETTKRALLRHHGKILISVRNEGYLIGAPKHIMEHTSKGRKRATNIARTNLKKLSTIDRNKLSDQEIVQLCNEQVKNGMMVMVYKVHENKLLKSDTVKLNQVSEIELMKQLLKCSENSSNIY